MQLHTIEQAAEILAIKPNAVKSLIRRGALPCVDVSVKPNSLKPRRRIRHEDLLAFVESRSVRVAPPVTLKQRKRYMEAAKWTGK